MSVRLFVGNLPYEATEEEIRAHFAGAGNVLNVFMPLDRETGRKRGFAFVEYGDNAQAQEAIRLFNNQNFKGRPLAVNEARARESRPPGTGAPYRPAGGPPRPVSSGPRPMTSGPRPAGAAGSHSGGHDFNRPDSGSMEPPGRGDRINRKFGPDAKPFRSRNQKAFKPEGGKKAQKEKLGGQLYSVDDADENAIDPEELDDFATSVEDDSPEDGE
jgi:RNA recognition motif-containing protein